MTDVIIKNKYKIEFVNKQLLDGEIYYEQQDIQKYEISLYLKIEDIWTCVKNEIISKKQLLHKINSYKEYKYLYDSIHIEITIDFENIAHAKINLNEKDYELFKKNIYNFEYKFNQMENKEINEILHNYKNIPYHKHQIQFGFCLCTLEKYSIELFNLCKLAFCDYSVIMYKSIDWDNIDNSCIARHIPEKKILQKFK